MRQKLRRWHAWLGCIVGLPFLAFKTREDAHTPFLIGFAILSLATVLLAVLLLPGTLRRRRR
jgi:hypothetical protein